MPWVLAKQKTGRQTQTVKGSGSHAVEFESTGEPSKVFNRYYHMFSEGELYDLTITAVQGLGLVIGNELGVSGDEGVEIVQCGWERSNYYIEIRRWRR